MAEQASSEPEPDRRSPEPEPEPERRSPEADDGPDTAEPERPAEASAKSAPPPEETARPRPERPAQQRAPEPEQGWDPENERDLQEVLERRRENYRTAAGVRSATGTDGPVSQGDGAPAVGTVHGNVYGSVTYTGRRNPYAAAEVSRERIGREFHLLMTAADGSGTTGDAVVRELGRSCLVVVSGPPGSGRTALARHALHCLLDPGKAIAEFRLRRRREHLQEIDLSQAAGYVVDADEAAAGRTLDEVARELAGRAEKHHVHMVAVVDSRRVPPGWQGFPLVEHPAPDPADVLPKLLQEVHQRSVAAEVLDDVLQHLPRVGMTDLVEAAAAVDKALREELPAATYLRSLLLRDVERRFAQPTDDDPWAEPGSRSPRELDHLEETRIFRRCFMLAAAVLDGLPPALVTDAAHDLSGRVVHRKNSDVPVVKQQFGQPSTPLLTWLDARWFHDPNLAVSRRLVLNNAIAGDVVLEHVWDSHHLANKAILDWLNDLAVDRRGRMRWPDEVRVGAAQATGRLAVHDFDRILGEVIERQWIDRGTVSGLRATAWAVDVMAEDTLTAAAVWSRVRLWGMGNTSRCRAALMVYAQRLPPPEGDTALALAERVAARPSNVDYAVAAVLVELAKIGHADQVIDLLVRWQRWIDDARREGRQLRRRVRVKSGLPGNAARTLLLVAANRGTRTHVLRRMADDVAVDRAVVELWRLAFADPALGTTACQRLADWLCAADAPRDEACAAVGGRVLGVLLQDPGLRPRLRFRAHRWLTEWDGKYPAARRLLTEALATPRANEEDT